MTRPPALAPPTLVVIALALAGCNPVAYVPTLLPSVPASAGVRAVGGGNLVGVHATAEVSAAPVSGVGVYVRGLYVNAALHNVPQQGGEVGLVAAPALSPRARLDLGVARGGGVVVEFPERTRMSQTSGHAGLLFGGPHDGERRGVAVRVTHVAAAADADCGGGRSGMGVFVEPAVRAGWVRGAVEVQGQFGLSVLVAGDLFDDYTSIPAFGGVTAAVRF